MLIDLSKFKQNFVKDTPEEIQEILAMKDVRRIPEGLHEVKVTGFYEKDGTKIKIVPKFGGCVGFSMIVKTLTHEEQLIYLMIPLHLKFLQARNEPNSYAIQKTINNLNSMGIRPDLLRLAIVESNGNAIESLIGANLVIENKWDIRKLHLEYDTEAKSYFFVKGDGSRFTSGEMAVPVMFDKDKKGTERWEEFIALATQNDYKLATQMDTILHPHPTLKNESINEELSKIINKDLQKKVVKPTSNFPPFPKKPVAQLDIESDVELGM